MVSHLFLIPCVSGVKHSFRPEVLIVAHHLARVVVQAIDWHRLTYRLKSNAFNILLAKYSKQRFCEWWGDGGAFEVRNSKVPDADAHRYSFADL